MADDQSISPAGHCGYVTFDEMAIQVRMNYNFNKTVLKI
jgi:hypothetical protein